MVLYHFFSAGWTTIRSVELELCSGMVELLATVDYETDGDLRGAPFVQTVGYRTPYPTVCRNMFRCCPSCDLMSNVKVSAASIFAGNENMQHKVMRVTGDVRSALFRETCQRSTTGRLRLIKN